MIAEQFYGLDIETDTTIDGLDPTVSAVVAVAVSSATDRFVLTGDERSILEHTERVVRSLASGVLVTWNGARFDLPFLAIRAHLTGVELSLQITPVGAAHPIDGNEIVFGTRFLATWGPHRHLDAFKVYRSDVGTTLGLSCGLKALSRLVHLEPVEVDRTRIDLLSDAELERYVASDAELARILALRRFPSILGALDRAPTVVTPQPRSPLFNLNNV